MQQQVSIAPLLTANERIVYGGSLAGAAMVKYVHGTNTGAGFMKPLRLTKAGLLLPVLVRKSSLSKAQGFMKRDNQSNTQNGVVRHSAPRAAV